MRLPGVSTLRVSLTFQLRLRFSREQGAYSRVAYGSWRKSSQLNALKIVSWWGCRRRRGNKVHSTVRENVGGKSSNNIARGIGRNVE